METEIATDPKPEDVQAIRDGLTAFNARHTVADGYEPLTVFVRDDQQVLRGGLLGETFWGWLHISIVWVDESVRGQALPAAVLFLPF